MKSIGLMLFILIALGCTRRISRHAAWDKKVYRQANTAKFAFYLSRRSKESIRALNLARMNPPLFAETYYRNYLLSEELIKSKEDSSTLKQKSAYSSLHIELLRTKPLQRMKPSFAMHVSSAFHALTSGLSGYTGHDRPIPFTTRLMFFGTFNRNVGENCDYGTHDPFEAIMDLMIDEGVAGYGHRRNLLHPLYKRVGCSFKFHRKYKWNYVQDFSTGNLFERKKARRMRKLIQTK